MMRDRQSWCRWVRVFRRDPAEEFDDELHFHIEGRVRDYVARGMDPESARRAALERLGDLERARDECTTLLSAERRADERRVLLNVSWLDVKLGFRMLARYPGLSLVGVLPALKATGRRLQAGLQQYASRGSAMQLGRMWSALIIVQVAVAVAALPAAVLFAEKSIWLGVRPPSAAAHGLLQATVVMQNDVAAGAADSAAAELSFRARFLDRMTELIRRLEAQPEVAGVTFADRFPGLERWASIEVERSDVPAMDTTRLPEPVFMGTRTSRVAIDLFDVLGVSIRAGRGFVPADARDGATAVIVSATFAERIAGGASVLGRRIRYAERGDDVDAGPWLEVVGVVSDFAHDFTTPNNFDTQQPRLFHAAIAGDAHPVTLVVRTRTGRPISSEVEALQWQAVSGLTSTAAGSGPA